MMTMILTIKNIAIRICWLCWWWCYNDIMIDDGTNDHNDYHCDDDYYGDTWWLSPIWLKRGHFLVCQKNINVRRWPRWEPPSSLLPALHRHDDDDDDDLHPHDDDDDDVDCDYGDPEEDRDDKCLMILSSQCDDDYIMIWLWYSPLYTFLLFTMFIIYFVMSKELI